MNLNINTSGNGMWVSMPVETYEFYKNVNEIVLDIVDAVAEISDSEGDYYAVSLTGIHAVYHRIAGMCLMEIDAPILFVDDGVSMLDVEACQ